jgi:cobalt-zinc-cadmium resistance protein CzcA
MLAAIVRASLRNRAVVVMGALLLVALGIGAALRLPIDAVPDVTTVQVQVITPAPALSPLEIEQYVSFPVERGPGRACPRVEEIRSLSRYGLSVVTVVFKDGTDIYFARQQVAERLQEIASRCRRAGPSWAPSPPAWRGLPVRAAGKGTR